VSIKWLFSIALLVNVIQAAPVVAKIDQLAEQCHIYRNFERLLLKEGQGLSARDVFVVEKGVAKIVLRGGTLLVGSSSKLRIKNDASGFWLELIEGEVFFDVEAESTSWLFKTPIVQLRGNAVGFYLSIGTNDIELTVIKGEVQWNNRWRDWSEPLMNTQVVLTENSISPIQKRALTALDREIYRTWLSGDHKKASDELSDLSGEAYNPRFEMMTLEEARRARLLQVNQFLELRKSDMNTLDELRSKESHRDLKEAIKEVDSFFFPAPLAPPPR
jgi:hypothetical protein